MAMLESIRTSEFFKISISHVVNTDPLIFLFHIATWWTKLCERSHYIKILSD